MGSTKPLPRILIELTPDEAVALHHAFINGLQTGHPSVRQTLTVKIERAAAQAQNVRAYEHTKVVNGKEAAHA